MVDQLVDGAAHLVDCEDPLDAELAGAIFVTMAASGGDETASLFTESLIPAIEARADEAALTLLTAIGAVDGGPTPVPDAAYAAAERMISGGLPAPAWARKLHEPMAAGPFTRLYDTDGTISVLAGPFERAGYEHALIIMVDHEDCGAAQDIMLVDGAELPAALESLRVSGRRDGFTIKSQRLSVPEFRWYAEQAMEARAVHDAENGGSDPTVDEEDGAGYDVLAVLARTRLADLPEPLQPEGVVAFGHDSGDELTDLTPIAALPVGRRTRPEKLPSKRGKAKGPASVYQLKVSLRGAKPPIWRRLEVPADITLAGLHITILAAFGWNGSHLHVFETAYGDFGNADPELGHRADGLVTLEQVASAVKERFRYTYDFGDDWEHEILVEKILTPDPSVAYPRCTGGKRAAPPDDCGGIWGYAEILDVLADPEHPDHEERLEWLGLDEVGEFTPDTFDLQEVNRRLGVRH
ncbi:plasmid pRiA4b ORF-3 family protein [Actinoplanes sp. NPDC051513]|uniref:plasmid pRiA4b ORF-3 family protein n=1 Tax=Actinoplanes sp. NPDC051513 TaxID=3363908 RepID=UPI00378F8955